MIRFPRTYEILKKEAVSKGAYQLIPIRYEDRLPIMKWRNEQLFHLRQKHALSLEQQDQYFEKTIQPLFTIQEPPQLLFSLLKDGELVAYGGLVHINWTDRNAEVSFVMDTSVQKEHFAELWETHLTLLKIFAFKYLNLHKIFTYAFDLRSHLYPALEAGGFREEGRLKQHCFFNGKYHDVLYHSCINPMNQLMLREADEQDEKLLFDWANNFDVRNNANNSEPINWEQHIKWFANKRLSKENAIFIFSNAQHRPVGQVRIDWDNGSWAIDYSVDKAFRGLGIGKEMISQSIAQKPGATFSAQVKLSNLASIKVFEVLGFVESERDENNVFFQKQA